MRAVGVFMMSIGLSWAGVASAQVAAVKGQTDSTDATGAVIGVLGTHNATTGTSPGVQGSTASTSPFASGVRGVVSSPTAGASSVAVLGEHFGTTFNGTAVEGRHWGAGTGVRGYSPSGIGVAAFGSIGVYGDAADGIGVIGKANGTSSSLGVNGVNYGLGRAGRFEVLNALSTADALRGETIGTGIGVVGVHSATTGTDPGVRGETNSTDSNAVGVTGIVTSGLPGSFSAGVRGINNGTGGNGIGVYGTQGGSGYGVYGTTVSGRGVYGQTGGLGIGVYAENNGTGTALLAQHAGASGNIAIFQSGFVNQARIDKNGVGYFNGGTQSSGADLAEAFDVEGDRDDYGPGDVLAISTRSDRTIEKSSAPNSTLVAGVYATKPGVLLTDLDIDAEASHRVPLGVVGVIPTKVSAENGAIRRGDLLTTAATRGHAMKAGATPAMGTVLGKALQDFAGPGAGIINVLVNVK